MNPAGVYDAVTQDMINRIEYSEKYMDDSYEYRHVILPKDLAKLIPKAKLLAESEWRSYGVQQSRGWEHYAVHKPEPHILLFRRALGTDPTTGKINPVLKEAALVDYNKEYSEAGLVGGRR